VLPGQRLRLETLIRLRRLSRSFLHLLGRRHAQILSRAGPWRTFGDLPCSNLSRPIAQRVGADRPELATLERP